MQYVTFLSRSNLENIIIHAKYTPNNLHYLAGKINYNGLRLPYKHVFLFFFMAELLKLWSGKEKRKKSHKM